MEVTNIIFNHQAGHTGDAMQIRWNDDVALTHREGPAGGEYQTDVNLNEPAAYIGGTKNPIVLVRIRLQSFAPNPQPYSGGWKATVMAVADNWFNLKEREVTFQDGVSIHGGSEFVPFVVDGTVPIAFDFFKFKWTFYAKRLRHVDVNPEVPEALNPVDLDPDTWVSFYETVRLHVYSTISAPKLPWFVGGSHRSNPWVIAFVFYGNLAEAFGKTTAAGVADRVTTYMFYYHGGRFDHEHALSYYRSASPQGGPSFSVSGFRLTDFMSGRNGPNVGSVDLAMAVTAGVELAAGGSAAAYCLDDYGFIPRLSVVGGATDCNNPLFQRFANTFVYVPNKTVGNDDLDTLILDNGPNHGRIARSTLNHHAWVEVNSGIYDATFGPFKAIAGADYLPLVRDTSTTGETKIRIVD